jgi:N-carbamoylputrescine amidase
MALDKADVIFMPHASPRGTPEEKLDSWMRHMTARAFDNGVYIAAVNQCGNNGGGLFFPGLSLVIGPDGLLKSKRMEGDDTIHLTDIDLEFLNAVRSHRMRYFLPNRRTDLFS